MTAPISPLFVHAPRFLRLTTLALWAVAFCLPGPARAHDSLEPGIRRAAPAVVRVSVMFDRERPRPGLPGGVSVQRPGSGALVDESGLVVTCAHLVAERTGPRKDEYYLEVGLLDGRRFPARIVALDERLDLALLRLELPRGTQLPALTLADPARAGAGAPVAALALPGPRLAFRGDLSYGAGPVRIGTEEIAADEHLLSRTVLTRDADGGVLCDASGAMLALLNASEVAPEVPREEGEGEEDEDAEPAERPIGHMVCLRSDVVLQTFAEHLTADLSAPRESSLHVAVASSVEPALCTVLGEGAALVPTAPEDPDGRQEREKAATGVWIAPDLVLTDGRVGVEGATVQVRGVSGKTVAGQVLVAKRYRGALTCLVRTDPDPDGAAVRPAGLGDSESLGTGESLVAVADAGSARRVATGVLSSLSQRGRLQVAMDLHAGFCGAPVLDLSGKVVGLAHGGIAAEGEGRVREKDSGLSLVTPIHRVREWFEDELAATGVEGLAEAAAPTEEEKALRDTPARRLAERVRLSSLNVFVRVEVREEKPAGGFDPFASPVERTFVNEGLGSGVVIDEAGLALTNWHVVDSATEASGEQREDHELEVSLADGRTYRAQVLSTSRVDDLALLSLELPEGETLTPVPLGDSDALRTGQSVFAVGNPFGLTDSFSMGIVSSKDRNAKLPRRGRLFRGLIQTDAAINPGNSGGALLDAEGRLVGINSAGARFVAGMGYAIPVERVRRVLDEVLLSETALRSAYWGVSVEEHEGAVRLTQVAEEGPADRAGLRAGDVLREIAGRAPATRLQFVRFMRETSADARVPVVVSREGERVELELQPLPYDALRVLHLAGVELDQVGYREESETLREVSIALHRRYTGDGGGEPREIMAAALRVRRTDPSRGAHFLLKPGDWLLGRTVRRRTLEGEQTELERFEDLAVLHRRLDALVDEADDAAVECWAWRPEKGVFSVRLPLKD